jgi:flagellar motor switch protein FliN/FliY
MLDDTENNEQKNEFESIEEIKNEQTVRSSGKSEALDAVYDVPVQIYAVLGRATMPVNQLLKLGRGAVVELDKRIGESIDIFVNNKLVARGEVVAVEDRLGITMTEIVKTERSL